MASCGAVEAAEEVLTLPLRKRMLEEAGFAPGGDRSETRPRLGQQGGDEESLAHDDWKAWASANPPRDTLQQLYPHARDPDCYMEELSHTYYVRGEAYGCSVSGVWKVFFEEFDPSTAALMFRKAEAEGVRSLEASIYWLYMHLFMHKRLDPRQARFWEEVAAASSAALRFYALADWAPSEWTAATIKAGLEGLLSSGARKPKGKSCYFLPMCAGCDAAALTEIWGWNGALESFKGTLFHKQAELYLQELGAWQLEEGLSHVPLREVFARPGLAERATAAATLRKAMLHVAPHVKAELWEHPATQRYFRGALTAAGPSPEYLRFEAWLRSKPSFSPYRTEWSIFDEDAGVAGQVDSLWFDEDADQSVVMADWKRARDLLTHDLRAQSAQARGEKGRASCEHAPAHPGPCRDMFNCSYNHYLVQQHLYADFLARKYNVQVRTLLLVQCHPELGATSDAYHEAKLARSPGLAQEAMTAFLAGWRLLLAPQA